jgi:hypothetical protein
MKVLFSGKTTFYLHEIIILHISPYSVPKGQSPKEYNDSKYNITSLLNLDCFARRCAALQIQSRDMSGRG